MGLLNNWASSGFVGNFSPSNRPIIGGNPLDRNFDGLTGAERLPLRLKVLYEGYGYRKYRMSKFETYELYIENKQFMTGEGIISFTDTAGRLMALKPDVTISIAKGAAAEKFPQKYYYNESVFRIESASREYREINQIGLEYIGASGAYQQAEVVGLALDSLAAVSGEYVLDISHMGFISGLLSELGHAFPREKALAALKRKNIDWLSEFTENEKLSGSARQALMTVASFREPLESGADKALELTQNAEMEAAALELAELKRVLSARGTSKNVFLDFSVLNDIDYYNGVVFQGYVRAAPRAVLTGGRYDNLMRRFGSCLPAIGFALYLSDFERALYDVSRYDADVLLIYDTAAPEQVARAVEKIIAGGESCRAEPLRLPGIRTRREIHLTDMEEGTQC